MTTMRYVSANFRHASSFDSLEQEFSQLQKIEFKKCEFTSQQRSQLMTKINSQHQTLKELTLAQCDLGNGNLDTILREIAAPHKFKKLQKLELWGNPEVSDEKLAAHLNTVLTNKPGLKLNITGCPLFVKLIQAPQETTKKYPRLALSLGMPAPEKVLEGPASVKFVEAKEAESVAAKEPPKESPKDPLLTVQEIRELLFEPTTLNSSQKSLEGTAQATTTLAETATSETPAPANRSQVTLSEAKTTFKISDTARLIQKLGSSESNSDEPGWDETPAKDKKSEPELKVTGSDSDLEEEEEEDYVEAKQANPSTPVNNPQFRRPGASAASM